MSQSEDDDFPVYPTDLRKPVDLQQLRERIERLKVEEQQRLAFAYKLPYDHKGIQIRSAKIEALDDVLALLNSQQEKS